MPGIEASEKHPKTTHSTTEARRVVRGYCSAIPPTIKRTMRHPPRTMPKGRLQICRRFCQVSASCHISAMTPNSTADAPKTIRPYNAVFIEKQHRRCCGPVEQTRSFVLSLSPPGSFASAPLSRRFVTGKADCTGALDGSTKPYYLPYYLSLDRQSSPTQAADHLRISLRVRCDCTSSFVRSSPIFQLGAEGNQMIETKPALELFQTPKSFEFVRWSRL